MPQGNLLISLRGTNGSGKSTVIRALLNECSHKPIYGVLGPRLPEAYSLSVPKCKKPVFVLGPYITICGGCDRLIPFDLIPELIERYMAKGHVIFEGVIVASVYGRVGALMEKYKKNSIMLFLDTSLVDCVQRVQGRRDSRTDTREFNSKHLEAKFKSIQRVREKVVADDIMRAVTTNSTTAHKKIIALLTGGDA